MTRRRTMGMSFRLKPKTVEALSRTRQARSLGGPRLISFSELIDEAIELTFGDGKVTYPPRCAGCGRACCSGEYAGCWGAGRTGPSSSP